MKRISFLLFGLMLAGGCGPSTVRTQPSTQPRSVPSSSSTPTSATPSPSHASPIHGTAITLTADLSSSPVRWQLIARIPFGSGIGDLGIITDRKVAPLPTVPSSFAIAQDGSIWVIDPAKRRLVHFTASGRFLRSLPGLFLDADHPAPEDLALTGSGAYVLETRDLVSRVATFEDARRVRTTALRTGGRLAIVSVLFSSTSGGVLGEIDGSVDAGGAGSGISEDPFGYASFDPSNSGQAHLLPGLPDALDQWISLRRATPTADQTFTLAYSSMASSVERPLRIRVIAKPGTKALTAVVGPEIQAALHNSVGMFVRLSTSDQSKTLEGGDWYLQIGPGQPVVWERLPAALIDDSRQVRHLAAGPNGSVYLMVAEANGESIYRR